MTGDQTIDFVLGFLTLGLVVLGLGSIALGKVVRWWDGRRAVDLSPDEAFMDAEPEPLGSAVFPLPNGVEPDMNGSQNAFDLRLNAAEVAALQRMIIHNKTAAKPSKSSTIQAGFGVSRGGSAAYQRASLIYDTLFGPPLPAVQYRPLTTEQQQLREQLALDKH